MKYIFTNSRETNIVGYFTGYDFLGYDIYEGFVEDIEGCKCNRNGIY